MTKKFVESIQIKNWEVLTENGYKPITHSNKTIEYNVYEVKLDNGTIIKCADDHIFIDKHSNQIYAKDSLNSELITTTGISTVTSVIDLNYTEHMYDLTVDSIEHTYFTNGVLSHNTTVATIILLHYALFNTQKRIALLANKGDAAREILDRIQIAFENLPRWMQSGVVIWNKGTIEFENGSRIIAASSSSSSIRGKSMSFVYIDECLGRNTFIRIKNKNGFEYNIKIGDFYSLLTDEHKTTDLTINSSNYQVLTKLGFQNFSGIKKSISNETLNIYFDDETIFTCTQYHFIEKDYTFIPSCLLSVGDIINNKKIIKISYNNKPIDVYDLLDVENGNTYYTDGINSHNCAFLDNWTDFYASVFPTLTSGEKTKMLFTSCVTKDTLVFTNKGIQSVSYFIDDTKDKLYQIADYEIYGHNKLRKGNLFYNNGYTNTKIIQVRSGEVECSLNHKWFAFKDNKYQWVETKDLVVGDYLVEQFNQQCFGNNDDISDFVPDTRYVKKFIEIPKQMTNDLAYFLGLYSAEGCASDKHGGYGVTLTCGDDISYAFDNIGLYHNKNKLHYRSGSKIFVQFMKYYGIYIKQKAHNKEVPSRILQSSIEIQRSWLSGYFDGDGSCSQDRISVVSTSKKMINQVKVMLMNMGIKCSYFITKIKDDIISSGIQGKHNGYTLELYGESAVKFHKEIGFKIKRKHDKFNIDTKIKRNGSPSDIIPGSKEIFKKNNVTGIWSGIGKKGSDFSRKYLLSIKDYIISNNYFYSDEIKFLYDYIISENLQVVPIKKITNSENYVYDFSLPDNDTDYFCHSVSYNGILGHQTPKGLNHFYEFWEGATKGLPDAAGNLVKNGFFPIFAPWYRVPGRGEKFKETILKGINYDYDRFKQEYECISGDSIITIQLEDNCTKNIYIEELERYCNLFKNVKILTINGFEKFHGVRSKISNENIFFKFSDNTSITTTKSHRFINDNNIIFAHDIKVGDIISSKKVSLILNDNTPRYMYDVLETESNTYIANDINNHNCEFLGSSGTLLNGTILKELISAVKEPVARNDYLTQYEAPIKDHIYFLIADVSRGKGLDYSAFSIIDVTTIPYKQVCVYRNNRITPADYASVIKHVGSMYNMAYVLVEINDLGGQVTYILRAEYDYENLLATESAGRAGKKLSAGFGNSVEDGLRTTISTKRLGCQVLKLLLEQHKLILTDKNTVKELQTFSKSGESYEAESGFHDDLVMGLVIFAYITQDAYFKDITNGDVVSQLRDMEEDQVTDDLIPFGIVTSATDFLEPRYVKIPGEKGVWTEHSSNTFNDYY